MDKDEVAIRILEVLNKRSSEIEKGAETFNDYMEVHQEYVKVLLQLHSVIKDPKIRGFFWYIISWPFLEKGFNMQYIGNPKIAHDLTNRLEENADCCLLVYLNSEWIDDLFKELAAKAEIQDPWSVRKISHERIAKCLCELLYRHSYKFNINQLRILERYCSTLYRFCEDFSDKLIPYLARIEDIITSRKYSCIVEELSNESIEINQDKERVKSSVREFNFSPDLIECLDLFDKKYITDINSFQFKETIGHVRDFWEELVIEIASSVSKICPVKPSQNLEKYGSCRDYLQQKGVNFLSPKQSEMIGAIWSFLSDTGTHCLKSDKEHARVAKNMCIEGALFMLERLKRYEEAVK
jgi:hypothetical protein